MKFIMTSRGFLEETSVIGEIVSEREGILSLLFREKVGESIKEWAVGYVKDFLMGVLVGVKGIMVDLVYSVALVGSGVFILLKVAGYESGYKKAGILFLANVLVKYLLG